MSTRAPKTALTAFAAPGVLVLGLFFIAPVTAVLIGAFSDGGAAFGRLAADPVFWNGLRGTLLLGTVAPRSTPTISTASAKAARRSAP